MEFKGSNEYVSTDDLSISVNAAINLEKPLLVKGEPGTGKTELARQISKSLNLEIIEWNIKSTTKELRQNALTFGIQHEKSHNNISNEIYYSGGPFTTVPIKNNSSENEKK